MLKNQIKISIKNKSRNRFKFKPMLKNQIKNSFKTKKDASKTNQETTAYSKQCPKIY
jgi:hypothetical protein